MGLKVENQLFSLITLLSDSSAKSSTKRAKIAEIASLVQVISSVGIGMSLTKAFKGLSKLSYLCAGSSILKALVLRDVYIVAKNTHSLMTDGWFGRAVKVGSGDPVTVVNHLVYNTLFIEPVFGSLLVSLLARGRVNVLFSV